MIKFDDANILDVRADALVNSVNIVGVMGKGVALAIKEAFPQNYKSYRKECENNNIKIGKVFVTETGQLFPRYIINFPTKEHWRYPSRYEWVEAGLKSLTEWIDNNEIKSIAIPPLGCGNGKLKWEKVREMILQHLKKYEDKIEIILLKPTNILGVKVVSTNKNVNLTPARAMLLYLMDKYQVLGYEITLLVIQKLAYFLQLFNEPLRLIFTKGYYGPYAQNLIPVLKILKDNYIYFKSLDELKPSITIQYKKEKQSEVNNFIETSLSEEQKKRLEQTLSLIKGFETPFGLELLGTIDFIMRQNEKEFSTSELLAEIKNWTKRKESLFKEYQVDVARKRLLEFFSY